MAKRTARKTGRKSARKASRKTARRSSGRAARKTARRPARSARKATRRTARRARRASGARRTRARRAAGRVRARVLTRAAERPSFMADREFRRIQVVKRDGSREDFDREKIRNGILRAAMRAGVDDARGSELAERITAMIEREARDGISTMEIRDILLRELDREERAIADSFRAFREGGL